MQDKLKTKVSSERLTEQKKMYIMERSRLKQLLKVRKYFDQCNKLARKTANKLKETNEVITINIIHKTQNSTKDLQVKILEIDEALKVIEFARRKLSKLSTRKKALDPSIASMMENLEKFNLTSH